MAREIQEGDGVRWTCAQAYEGLGDDPEAGEAARVAGTDRYRVVCTPSGGSRSVTVELPEGWEEALSDEELLARVHEAQD